MSNFRILLIEDNPEQGFLLKEHLERLDEPAHATLVTSGEDATALLDAEDDSNRTDLVVLDVNLPGMSGFGVLQWLRSHAVHASTPVIVLSGSRTSEDVRSAYRGGANAYMLKPKNGIGYRRLAASLVSYWRESVVLPHAKSAGPYWARTA